MKTILFTLIALLVLSVAIPGTMEAQNRTVDRYNFKDAATFNDTTIHNGVSIHYSKIVAKAVVADSASTFVGTTHNGVATFKSNITAKGADFDSTLDVNGTADFNSTLNVEAVTLDSLLIAGAGALWISTGSFAGTATTDSINVTGADTDDYWFVHYYNDSGTYDSLKTLELKRYSGGLLLTRASDGDGGATYWYMWIKK
jgi:hypothetical protein